MLSDPKDQQKNLEFVHQFVTTAHLFTAYSASLSQYANENKVFAEIDFSSWQIKIDRELHHTVSILKNENIGKDEFNKKIIPDDMVTEMLEKRKEEIAQKEIYDYRDPKKISYLTEIKTLKELLELIYNEAKKQRKIVQNITD